MITLKHFTASWCKPCEKLISIMDEITNDYPDIEYIIIDLEPDKKSGSESGIRGLPTIILEKDGIEFKRIVGIHKKYYYEKILNELLNN